MNMDEYTSIWQSAAGAAEERQYLKQLLDDFKTIFLNGTKCKICFKYVGVNCKRNKSERPVDALAVKKGDSLTH